jgi:glycosyltransferase involved in cell wall biosynthesis
MHEELPPKVSVVITCYNYGDYLEEAIDSVLGSTFTDIEIIVVNDGSTDPHTLSVLDQLNKPKTRVVHQTNMGAAAARNAGIRQARGEYIYSLDADDKVHPTLLEKAVAVLDKRPKVGMVSSWLRAFGQKRFVVKYRPYNFYMLLFRNNLVSGSMFRKIAWEQAGGYYESLLGYEDWEFWISIGAKGWLGYIIPEPLFLYRKHPNSKTRRSRAMHKQLMYLIREKHKDLYTAKKLAELKRIWMPRPLRRSTPLRTGRGKRLKK